MISTLIATWLLYATPTHRYEVNLRATHPKLSGHSQVLVNNEWKSPEHMSVNWPKDCRFQIVGPPTPQLTCRFVCDHAILTSGQGVWVIGNADRKTIKCLKKAGMLE